MDAIFRALADPTRRSLLDELFRADGQTLSALEARFAMSRFGVMKHLKRLEQAGLVVTRRRGREKLHFLNPVPIRLVHDRWVSKYAEPWAAALSELKHSLEEKTMEKVFEIYIKTTPARLWRALTDPEQRSKLWRERDLGLETGLALRVERQGRQLRAGRGRNPRERSAAPVGTEHDRALERRGEERGHVADHVRDRADRR